MRSSECKGVGEAAREREQAADAARAAAQRSAADAAVAAGRREAEAARLQHQLTAAQAGMEVRPRAHTRNEAGNAILPQPGRHGTRHRGRTRAEQGGTAVETPSVPRPRGLNPSCESCVWWGVSLSCRPSRSTKTSVSTTPLTLESGAAACGRWDHDAAGPGLHRAASCVTCGEPASSSTVDRGVNTR